MIFLATNNFLFFLNPSFAILIKMDLFSKFSKHEKTDGVRPLADRLRPQKLEEFVGQKHILSPDTPFRKSLEAGNLSSLVFWGPPGSGKTTLAYLIAKYSNRKFIQLSAVTSSIVEVKKLIEQASFDLNSSGQKTILFIDEIHRFNKAQQDAFLPCVEKGIITLIGATTENPSFEVISALLSRVQVIPLYPLSFDEIREIVVSGLNNLSVKLKISEEAINGIAQYSFGDARKALNIMENLTLASSSEAEITAENVEALLQKKIVNYDKGGEEHFNIISALHKSMRGSDPDASIYWVARMLEAGEDPLYVARRIVRFASEDIGLADPKALEVALNAYEAVNFIGMPEGALALAEAAVYMAVAPKSNALYTGYMSAKEDIKKYGHLPVPLHIRNAPTKLMKELGYGKDYKYPHEFNDAFVEEEYLPDKLKERIYYHPKDRGLEIKISEKLKKLWKKRRK